MPEECWRLIVQDIFAAVPFLFLVIVPLGELLLPLIIKFVPGMMPSTFAKQYDQARRNFGARTRSRRQDEKKRKLLKVRLEMAKLLTGTIRESGIAPSDKVLNSEAFREFFRKVRQSAFVLR